MRQVHLLLVVLLGWLAAAPAQGPTKYFTRSGTITFFSATPMEDISATNSRVAAAVDVQSGQVVFTVLMQDFQFPKKLMQTHFNENYVESEKYPKATFTGQLVGFQPTALDQAGPQPTVAEGDLTIHGVKRHVRVPGSLEKRGNRLLVNTKFSVETADYNIEIPALVRGHIAKTVDVTVALACDPMPLP
jgi:polyisoprenoid-binding protein YceI